MRVRLCYAIFDAMGSRHISQRHTQGPVDQFTMPGISRAFQFNIPMPPSLPKPPSDLRGSLPNGYRVFSEAYFAAGWHDQAPGETRVHLDYAGLVTLSRHFPDEPRRSATRQG